jgi:hypothetical protein
LPFGRRPSLLGPSCPTGEFRFPHGRPTSTDDTDPGPQPGFPRSTRMRHDRGGCPLYPGDGGVLPAEQEWLSRHPPLLNGQPLLPRCHDPSRSIRSHETSSKGSRSFTRPVFPSPVAPGWNGSPPAFPRAPHPAVYQQRTSGRGLIVRTLIRNYTLDLIEPPTVKHSHYVRLRVAPPPCGVPVSVRRTCPSSITPARRIARSSFSKD